VSIRPLGLVRVYEANKSIFKIQNGCYFKMAANFQMKYQKYALTRRYLPSLMAYIA
jgi:hypothetical protein